MSNTSLLGSFGGQAGDALMFRNVLINGCFRVWQRGTSQADSGINGYGSDDRWANINNGSTKTHSRQTFTIGQTDVPGNPDYFSRTVVTTVAGVNNFVLKGQKIESVKTFAGQTATLSFWAKADASKNMAVEFTQSFGSGGSPSAAVLGIGVTTIALTTSWRYYTVTVSIPSISGKTLGTANDDFLGLNFWFDAGSGINARTNSLGQQSGTFDIAQVQLEAGPTATPFERRPIGTELALCQRYYQLNLPGAGYAVAVDRVTVAVAFSIPMRTALVGANLLIVNATGALVDYNIAIRNITSIGTLTHSSRNGVTIDLGSSTTSINKPQGLSGECIAASAEL